MNRIIWIMIILLSVVSCGDDEGNNRSVGEDDFIRAVDMSFLPEIEQAGYVYKNVAGQPEDALVTLKNAGVNTIRIRLWKDPATVHSSLVEVKTLAARVKALGMKVWLTVHYSDSWADPSQQATPQEWNSLDLEQLKSAATAYTSQILSEIDPDIIQIGNETNTGFMYPLGNLVTNEAGYLELVNAISATIRSNVPDTKIMIHYAGIENAEWFFDKIENVDFDYIGLSYYPVWHGKSLADVQAKMQQMGQANNKKVLIAETSYPFTLEWNDQTGNIVGQNGQIISQYPASQEGQKAYLMALRNAVEDSGTGTGFCYWGADWVAFRGPQATDGSAGENLTLWGFDGKALPAMGAFYKE